MEPEEEKMKKKKKKKKGHGHGEILHLKNDDEERFAERELALIHTPYCNFSNKFGTIVHY